jgi:RasGEF N-terminal motif
MCLFPVYVLYVLCFHSFISCHPFLSSSSHPFVGDIHFRKESGGYFVTACSFDRLVERIMDEHYRDPDFLSTVLLTHSYYTTATLLLGRIIAFYMRHVEIAKATDSTDTIWIDTLLEQFVFIFFLTPSRSLFPSPSCLLSFCVCFCVSCRCVLLLCSSLLFV